MKTMRKMKTTVKVKMRAEAMRMLLAVLLMSALTACNPRSAEKSFKAERANRAYQTAMKELSAGRMAAAVGAFEEAIKADPGNTSAHFQLACLLHEHRRDYLGAIGEYRVFLLLAPNSEKATLAQARIVRCEQLYRERMLRDDAAKIAGTLKTENDSLTQSLDEAESRLGRLKKELESAQTKLASEQKENARLRVLLESQASDDEAARMELTGARELLEEEEPLAPAPLSEAMRLAAEAEAEDVAAGTQAALLQGRRPTSVTTNATDKTSTGTTGKELPPRPDVYVVQNGDTLYKIANRFYGKTSAWKAIRDANKETISTDGRVRAGQKIRLP